MKLTPENEWINVCDEKSFNSSLKTIRISHYKYGSRTQPVKK